MSARAAARSSPLALLAGLARFACARQQLPALRARAGRAHRDRRRRPQRAARSVRPDLVRPRRLLCHRRLHGRHPHRPRRPSASGWRCRSPRSSLAVAGALLAVPALRVRGPYLAMVTIAFGFIVEQARSNGAASPAARTASWAFRTPSSPAASSAEREHRRARRSLLTARALCAVRAAAREPLGQGDARGARFRGRRASRSASTRRRSAPSRSRSRPLLPASPAAVRAAERLRQPRSRSRSSSRSCSCWSSWSAAPTACSGPLVGALVVVLLPELLSGSREYRLLFVRRCCCSSCCGSRPAASSGLVGRLLATPGKSPPRRSRARRRRATVRRGSGRRTALRSTGLVDQLRRRARRRRTCRSPREPGRITSIIGPNGAGKTHACSISICGFYRPDRGSIRLGRRDIAGMPSHRDRARRHRAHLPDDAAVRAT